MTDAVNRMSQHSDPWDGRQLRNRIIPLPGPDEGYGRAVIIGTTGSGKTTLLRQLMGTAEERFPPTASGRTTTCDIEVVFADAPAFTAAATFLPREQVRLLIEECVLAAVEAKLLGSPDQTVSDRLLSHRHQGFRLSYLIGHPRRLTAERISNSDGLLPQEASRLLERLQCYLGQVDQIASSLAQLRSGDQIEQASTRDQEAAAETALEVRIASAPTFGQLVDTILTDVQRRMVSLIGKDHDPSKGNWPEVWSFSTGDRQQFVDRLRTLTGNDANRWGQLLTPVVDGLRIRGPLLPEGFNRVPKLVIIDGEGLGHKADTVASLPTRITELFDSVDTILLADHALQPMLGGSQAVFRSTVASGHVRKLCVCFTHMDQVEGDNMPDDIEKIEHVRASMGPIFAKLSEEYGRAAIARLEATLAERCLFFFNLDKHIAPGCQSDQQLRRLISMMGVAFHPEPRPRTRAAYDLTQLGRHVFRAGKKYHDRWLSVLGLQSSRGVDKEHWTRIKALTRRLGQMSQDYYDNLRPVSDLIAFMMDEVSRFFSVAAGEASSTDDQWMEFVEGVKREVFANLHTAARSWVWTTKVAHWNRAYEFAGTGSAKSRAEAVAGILKTAFPACGDTESSTQASQQVLRTLEGIVQEALRGSLDEIPKRKTTA